MSMRITLMVLWGVLRGRKFTGYLDRDKKPLFVGDRYSLFSITGQYIKDDVVTDLFRHPTIPEYFDYFLPISQLIKKH